MSTLKVTGLGKSFASRTIFSGIDLALTSGVYALSGKNGCGKSTLLKLLAGVVPPDRGTIVVDGHDLARAEANAKRSIGYMPDSEAFYDFVTPAALWQLIARARGVAGDEGRMLASRLGLSSYVDQPLGALSQGTRRKAFLVGAFIGTPPVILLDEPSNALDAAAHAELYRLVNGASNSVVLMSTHDVKLTAATQARLLALSERGIAAAPAGDAHATAEMSLRVAQ
ncbi:ABC transporter ATP-binding protein [bacterium M00.F.Ca.ET.228.01.1.1]|uniref:ATP-binding cassette domain-containing protein n=1 Tax=Paraburkholderia phenoliruptrix TaxID=252970 RepID=UPI001093067C|nr:ABC transporter ATP-binding protein [Paraburkholderia phenoliruptrix]TGP43101.1 ABC transporter ATP-binding protein [bacterium M00.F.Ca.ET.228.01.1.1]TGS00540.1 ABC transporter ATP-binding protein [bacterium M00.F.Ca.ET.191.01.1.1]TGU04926.1 ABC transporter ATP-binding protein [bacterium M00.F.Ca.ET.155.01.1.1]MBW0446968.1 ABC transporter ATP-binding protein [Paraburkholderia phenoliruptrix]MBW9099464.1 ABC transporter ATP-binding protein [Paraburkholderia phenoliruptrix]